MEPVQTEDRHQAKVGAKQDYVDWPHLSYAC